MTQPNAFDVSDQFGSGGTGLADDGASGPSDGSPALRTQLRNIKASIWAPFANTTAMQASLAANRSDGQLAVRLSDYSVWTWEAASAAAADAQHIAPTDVGAGVGRWVLSSGAAGGMGIQEISVPITPALIAALGAVNGPAALPTVALPAGARWVGCELAITVLFGFSAGSSPTLTVELGDGTTVNRFLGVTHLDAVDGALGDSATAGAGPDYLGASVGGVALTATVTSTVSLLSLVNAGAATLKVFYYVLP